MSEYPWERMFFLFFENFLGRQGSRDLEYRGRRKVIVLDPKDPCVSTEEESAAASYFDRVAGRHVGDNEALGSARWTLEWIVPCIKRVS